MGDFDDMSYDALYDQDREFLMARHKFLCVQVIKFARWKMLCLKKGLKPLAVFCDVKRHEANTGLRDIEAVLTDRNIWLPR